MVKGHSRRQAEHWRPFRELMAMTFNVSTWNDPNKKWTAGPEWVQLPGDGPAKQRNSPREIDEVEQARINNRFNRPRKKD